jgi:2-polyprenyl-3-methyl-5-hydroxy-6-metoxy-1,4-benzoquinol methylase
MTDPSANHWADVYERKAPEEVSWYEEQPTRSLDLVRTSGVARDAPIIDVGGGTSALAAALVAEGYSDVTVADISPSAIDRAEKRAGSLADRINFVLADVRDHDFDRPVEIWHDRAVYHFMVTEDDRDGYLSTLRKTLRPGGHLLVATFGLEGPEQCSGLPTCRYDAPTLAAALGGGFSEVASGIEVHRTPGGTPQQFLFAHFLRTSES